MSDKYEQLLSETKWVLEEFCGISVQLFTDHQGNLIYLATKWGMTTTFKSLKDLKSWTGKVLKEVQNEPLARH